MKEDKHSEQVFTVGDFGTGHRESRMAGGEDPEMFMESASGERVALATGDIHQGVSYQPGTAACGFDCHVDPKYGFVPEADCPVHDRKSLEAMTEVELFGLTDDEKRREHIQRPPVVRCKETIVSVAAMQIRAGSLFSEMIQGKIRGYRVEMDRSVHPPLFHITTYRKS